MNYKLFYYKVREQYPEIAERLMPKTRPMTKELVFKCYDLFCGIKGIECDTLRQADKRLFLMVAILVFNPEYIASVVKKMRMGLRPILAIILKSCENENVVSYHVREAASDYKIYRPFKEETDTITEIILKELSL